MTFVVYIVIGLICGFAANHMLYRNRGEPFLNFVVGAAGALVGAYLYLGLLAVPFGASGVTPWSMLIAIAGAIVLLVIKHAVLGNRPAGT